MVNRHRVDLQAMTTKDPGPERRDFSWCAVCAEARRQRGTWAQQPAKLNEEDHVDEKLDAEALSAAIAGFLACHVLTLQFLVTEGIVDKDRLIPYFENAMRDMAPGIADQRSLFVLSQILKSLRGGVTAGLQ